MPTYDYRIEATGDVVEVKHTMALTPRTWDELCELCNLDPSQFPLDSSVTKLLSSAGIVKNTALKNPTPPPCMTGGGCPSGGCGQ